jgi:hypothetical protein
VLRRDVDRRGRASQRERRPAWWSTPSQLVDRGVGQPPRRDGLPSDQADPDLLRRWLGTESGGNDRREQCVHLRRTSIGATAAVTPVIAGHERVSQSTVSSRGRPDDTQQVTVQRTGRRQQAFRAVERTAVHEQAASAFVRPADDGRPGGGQNAGIVAGPRVEPPTPAVSPVPRRSAASTLRPRNHPWWSPPAHSHYQASTLWRYSADPSPVLCGTEHPTKRHSQPRGPRTRRPQTNEVGPALGVASGEATATRAAPLSRVERAC